MEVRATRRGLIRTLRRHADTDVSAILDGDFLAVADQPTIVHVILDAASD